MTDMVARRQKAQAKLDQMDKQIKGMQEQYKEAVAKGGEKCLAATRLYGQLNGMTQRYWSFYKTYAEPENPLETEERERREQVAKTPTEEVKTEDIRVGDVLLTSDQDTQAARLGIQNYHLSTITHIEIDDRNADGFHFQIAETHYSGIYSLRGAVLARVVTE